MKENKENIVNIIIRKLQHDGTIKTMKWMRKDPHQRKYGSVIVMSEVFKTYHFLLLSTFCLFLNIISYPI